MNCWVCTKQKSLTDFGACIDKVYICKSCKTDFKRCAKCENIQHVSSFFHDKSTKSGRQSWCKSCNKQSVNIRRFGETKNASFVNARRDADDLRYARSISTDLESYDIWKQKT